MQNPIEVVEHQSLSTRFVEYTVRRVHYTDNNINNNNNAPVGIVDTKTPGVDRYLTRAS